MKHLSALKKQYRDDLESLTTAYETRRRVLKDALLLYSGSGPANNTSGNHKPSAHANNHNGGSYDHEHAQQRNRQQHNRDSEDAAPKHSRMRSEDKNGHV